MSIEHELEELRDERAIERLVAVYSDAATCRDATAAAAVYAEDAVLRAFSGEPIVGRQAIEQALRTSFGASTARDARGAPSYFIQITRFTAVDIDGDNASGRSYYLAIGRGPAPADVGRLETGRNEDRYVRTPHGWRIASRRITRNYVGDMALPGNAFAFEAGAWPTGPSADRRS
jgi:uncharacterized protein (TIGR02246 family)